MKKNYHLVFSVFILLPLVLAYGTGPECPSFFHFKIEETDLKNILRAIMGLYLAMLTLWIIGVFKQQYWFTATITNVLFFSGLGFGRLLSLVLDGMPSTNFFIGMIAEFLIAFWGIYNLKLYKNIKKITDY